MVGKSDDNSATFVIASDDCPQVLCRLLGYIAQQSRIVERMRARRCGQLLWIAIVVTGIDLHRAKILKEKMNALITVVNVKIFWNGGSV